MAEQLQFFASLDFPGRTTLYVWEISERLGLSEKKLFNDIDSGALVVLDFKSSGVSRRCARVPVECYRDYVFKRLTGSVDLRMKFLGELPPPVKRQLLLEVARSFPAHDHRGLIREMQEALRS